MKTEETAPASPWSPGLKLGNSVGRRVDVYYKRIRELGLEPYVAELNAYGYTVIPPEIAAPKAQVEKITQALLRAAEKRTGVSHALDRNGDAGSYDAALIRPDQYIMFYLLFEDEAFEDWLENPVLQAMVDQTMRGAGQVSSLASFVKWKGEGLGNSLGLHTDTPASPEGLLPATHDIACNSALILTDYSRENGALAVVPGSHLLRRNPRPGEGEDEAVAIEAPAGSMIFWRGATWHGAFPKRTDGLRLNLTTYFCHRTLKTQERYQAAVPQEMLDRHSKWFGRALGADDMMGGRIMGSYKAFLSSRFVS